MKFKVMLNFLLLQMYSDRRGNGQKPPRTKPSRRKTLWENPRTKTPANNWERICTGGFCPGFLYQTY